MRGDGHRQPIQNPARVEAAGAAHNAAGSSCSLLSNVLAIDCPRCAGYCACGLALFMPHGARQHTPGERGRTSRRRVQSRAAPTGATSTTHATDPVTQETS